MVNNQTNRAVFYGAIDPTPVFPEDGDLLPLDLPVQVRFPQAGRYTVQISFFQDDAADVLKMEQPFYVLKTEE